MTNRILPVHVRPSRDNIMEAIHIALGRASAAWEPMGTPDGVFDSDVCQQLGNELMELITLYCMPYWSDQVARQIIHGQETMTAVYKAMVEQGLSANKIVDVTMAIQDKGILFRHVGEDT